MKAIQIRKFGGTEVLNYCELDIPRLEENQVLVRVKAAGVNFIDIYQRSGLYRVELPNILGLEGAGIIEKIGIKVTDFNVGEKVAFIGAPKTYAEYSSVDSSKLIKLPAVIDYESAAAAMLQGMTAHYLAYSTFPLKPGHRCLIHAAAGGVGLLLIQMAKRCGANVIGTVSTRQKFELAKKAGADEVVIYTQEDFEKKVLDYTNSEKVDVVYDSVGKATFNKSLNCLKQRGLLVLYGQSSGPVQNFDPQILNQKGSLFLTRPSLFHYISDRKSLEKRANDVLGWISSGELKLQIYKTYRLKEAAMAHEDLESRKTTGKLLLLP